MQFVFIYVPHWNSSAVFTFGKLAEMYTRKASWDFFLTASWTKYVMYIWLKPFFFHFDWQSQFRWDPRLDNALHVLFVHLIDQITSLITGLVFFCIHLDVSDSVLTMFTFRIEIWAWALDWAQKCFKCNMNCRISVVSHRRIRK